MGALCCTNWLDMGISQMNFNRAADNLTPPELPISSHVWATYAEENEERFLTERTCDTNKNSTGVIKR